MTSTSCPECKAEWLNGRTCADAFHQALAWDFEDPAGAWPNHHLTVLCYHLQHPSLYSPEGLEYANGLLIEFVEKGKAPASVRHENSEELQNSRRKWTVTGSGSAKGEYLIPPRWTVTVQDVVAGGLENYPGRVKTWAESLFRALKESGNI